MYPGGRFPIVAPSGRVRKMRVPSGACTSSGYLPADTKCPGTDHARRYTVSSSPGTNDYKVWFRFCSLTILQGFQSIRGATGKDVTAWVNVHIRRDIYIPRTKHSLKMAWRKGWERVRVTPCGEIPSRDAVAPVIVTASRSTDIPAFYGEWLIGRLRKGHAARINPFSGRTEYVSFEKTRLIVFWTKNPAPFFRFLPELDGTGLSYLFQYTLNDYGKERLEPGIPLKQDRITSFTDLSRNIGKGRMVWRYDPVLLSGSLDVEGLLSRIADLGDALRHSTGKLVISFIDIDRYPRVQRNLVAAGFGDVREPTSSEIEAICTGLADMNREWKFDISACGESMDLSAFGIEKGQCINYAQIVHEFPGDKALIEFLNGPVLEKGLEKGLRA